MTNQSAQMDPDRLNCREARRFVGEVLDRHGIDGEVRELVILLTSELATNAILHAHTAFCVEADVLARRVKVSVTDRSPAPVHVEHPEEASTRGRGLMLVETLSGSWGVDRLDEGKRVWFEIVRADESGDGPRPS